MKTRERPRRIDKKSAIVTAATNLFNRYGIRRVTVEEICRKAGTSKMTFYKHFENKLDLFKYIWNGVVDEAYRELDEIDALPISFTEKLKRIMDYKVSIMSSMSPEFTAELLDGTPELAGFMESLRKRSFGLFLKFAERAQSRGDMRKMRPELFLAMLDKMGEVAQNARLRALYDSEVDFVRELNDFLFYGLLPGYRDEAER